MDDYEDDGDFILVTQDEYIDDDYDY